MKRFKLTVEYHGAGFKGWQRQSNQPTVQGAIEEAILKFSGAAVTLQAAGRTDSGVHAMGQVAHFDLDNDIDALKVREALNYHLKRHKIAIIDVENVDHTFQARFCAQARHYLYRIRNRRACLTLDYGLMWHVPVPLNVDRMHQAAQLLLGTHDFSTFRSTQCQATSPVRSMDRCDVIKMGDEIQIVLEAKSFLHNQVRSIAGSLQLVGRDKWTIKDFENAFKAADRTKCGPVAPPYGLYFTRVIY